MTPASADTGNIVALWMQTARLMRDRIFCATDRKGANPLQVFAAFIISEHEGLTMKELADHLGITSPSATSLVDRLVRMEWVKRSSDPKNRKLVRIRMAPAGKRALAAIMRKQAQAMEEVLALLDTRDRTDFSRILANLHTALLTESKHP